MITGSKKEILDLIKTEGTLTVQEASKYTDLAKTTLREHLLQLERDGYIERAYKRSGPGRPTLQYRLTQKGHTIYPSLEPEMMRDFLNYLKNQGVEDLIETFFKSYWDKLFKKANRILDEAPSQKPEESLDLISRMLEEEGFMPKYKSDDTNGEASIKECNCPFREIVKETRLPCKFEAEFYQRLFKGDVRRTTHIAEGDYSCTYCVNGTEKN